MSNAQQIIDHWERHGKFQQTEADKAFGDPVEVVMARELLMLRHSCRMAVDFIEDGKSALAAMSIRATLDVIDNATRETGKG
jgi:hypothetical protein